MNKVEIRILEEEARRRDREVFDLHDRAYSLLKASKVLHKPNGSWLFGYRCPKCNSRLEYHRWLNSPMGCDITQRYFRCVCGYEYADSD